MIPVTGDLIHWDLELTRGTQVDLLNHLASIELRFKQNEPEIQSYLPEHGRFERLRTQIAELFKEYPDPEDRPPLFGMLIGIKDIFQVDGFETRAGSKLPPEVLRSPEGRAVRRFQESGALVIGKTVTTEFAYFGPGPTRNPHNLSHTPGGSSSGSAAAIAAGFGDLTLGTQTIGSVIRPAAFCGVLGYKPTFGRIPTSGVIPLSPALDHVGLFAASLEIIEASAGVVVGGWTPGSSGSTPALGIPEGPYLDQISAAGLKNFQDTVSLLEETGFEVTRIPAFQDFKTIFDRHYLIVAGETAKIHQDWYEEFKSLYHPKTSELIEMGRQIPLESLVRARSQRTELREQLGSLMDAHKIDLWITPSALGPAPEGLDSTGDPVMNLPWTQAGFPALNLPAGLSDSGLPMGLQVVGRFGSDESLLDYSKAISKTIRKGLIRGA